MEQKEGCQLGKIQDMSQVQSEAVVPGARLGQVPGDLPRVWGPICHQAPGGSTALNTYPANHYPFPKLCVALTHALVHKAPYIDSSRWQSQTIEGRPEMTPKELTHVSFDMRIPEKFHDLQHQVLPNLPWAEDHFFERVSGVPYNPAPSEAWWPHAVRGNEDHKMTETYSHTYPERMWPKFANTVFLDEERIGETLPHHGIRFEYGDLRDVVTLLQNEPATRQAYLPIWFPEDTGVVHGERVPCTLGYHFQMRLGRLDIVYFMRSCDFVRHFRDDVYMAARLCQWVADQIDGVFPGNLVMHISSLHIFRGDVARLQRILDET
jgi:Thymidylate synthase